VVGQRDGDFHPHCNNLPDVLCDGVVLIGFFEEVTSVFQDDPVYRAALIRLAYERSDQLEKGFEITLLRQQRELILQCQHLVYNVPNVRWNLTVVVHVVRWDPIRELTKDIFVAFSDVCEVREWLTACEVILFEGQHVQLVLESAADSTPANALTDCVLLAARDDAEFEAGIKERVIKLHDLASLRTD